jgi:hypothetical protein
MSITFFGSGWFGVVSVYGPHSAWFSRRVASPFFFAVRVLVLVLLHSTSCTLALAQLHLHLHSCTTASTTTSQPVHLYRC